MTRIHLISGPRNISTALMYAFGNRGDCSIVDEPFYASYLEKTGFNHPGRAEVLATMNADAEVVKREIIFGNYSTPLLFIKDMAHHLEQLDYHFLLKNEPVFLIRDIAKVINSTDKVYPSPSLQDIGIKAEWEIYDFLVKNGKSPLIFDTDRLLDKPETQLQQACVHLGIPFKTSMLQWSPGPRSEDGVWAKYWYHSVHKSTGFKKQPTTKTELPERLLPLYEEALPYYNKMLEQSLS